MLFLVKLLIKRKHVKKLLKNGGFSGKCRLFNLYACEKQMFSPCVKGEAFDQALWGSLGAVCLIVILLFDFTGKKYYYNVYLFMKTEEFLWRTKRKNRL